MCLPHVKKKTKCSYVVSCLLLAVRFCKHANVPFTLFIVDCHIFFLTFLVEVSDRLHNHHHWKPQQSPRIVRYIGPEYLQPFSAGKKFLFACHACTLTLHRGTCRLLDSTNAHHPKLHLKEADKNRASASAESSTNKVCLEGRESQRLGARALACDFSRHQSFHYGGRGSSRN